MLQRPVNDAQLAVLRWIADGCPDGVMVDTSYKTSAVALRNRGLVTVSKRGGWHAAATAVGIHFLEHGVYPEAAPKPAVTSAPPRPRAAKPPRPSPAPAQTDDPDVELAVAAPEEAPVARPTHVVQVPQRLSKPHALVSELKSGNRFEVSKASVPRVLRIIHALALAFEKQGWAVQSAAKARTESGRSWDSKDLFVVSTGEYREGIRIREENDRTPHTPTAQELREQQRYSWHRIPDYDYAPSGRIFIEIHSSWRGTRYRWSDRQRWKLEDKLGQIVDEIEARSLKEREARLKRQAEEAERQRRAELAIEVAKVELRESHRQEALLQQSQVWHQVNLVRGYLDAMQHKIDLIQDAEQADRAIAWLEWSRGCADRLDPLGGEIGFPADPEPTAEALRPFLPAAPRRSW